LQIASYCIATQRFAQFVDDRPNDSISIGWWRIVPNDAYNLRPSHWSASFADEVGECKLAVRKGERGLVYQSAAALNPDATRQIDTQRNQ